MPKKKIFYLGTNGFPFGLAQVQRQIMVSKILLEAGFNVTVLNTNPIRNNKKIKFSGVYKGIHYIYTCLTSRYFNSFIFRNIIKAIGKFNESLFIIAKGLFSKEKIILLTNTLSYYQLKYYYLLSRIIHTELIYDYVEYVGAMKSKPSVFRNNNRIFDRSIEIFPDKIICISEFLLAKTKELNSNKITIKIPSVTDFELFDKINAGLEVKHDYLLFCGSVNYIEIIEFIISAFEQIEDKSINLIIIASGDKNKIDCLKKRIILSSNESKISILSNINFEDLVSYYKSAKGLLIPLMDGEKDKARFPHKISEYAAAGRPIVTTNFGEISNYFKDNINALIADEFDIVKFSEKINYLIAHPEKGDEIGRNSRKLGEKYFNYKTYINSMNEFINKL